MVAFLFEDLMGSEALQYEDAESLHPKQSRSAGAPFPISTKRRSPVRSKVKFLLDKQLSNKDFLFI